MRFEPKRREDIAQPTAALWPAGTYDFQVVKAGEKISQGAKTAGESMINLQIQIFDRDGNTRTVFDNLMPSVTWKLLNFCDCAGLTDAYESGELEPYMCDGKTGVLKLRIDPAKNGYEAKNSVADYLIGTQSAPVIVSQPRSAQQAATAVIDDDVPF